MSRGRDIRSSSPSYFLDLPLEQLCRSISSTCELVPTILRSGYLTRVRTVSSLPTLSCVWSSPPFLQLWSSGNAVIQKRLTVNGNGSIDSSCAPAHHRYLLVCSRCEGMPHTVLVRGRHLCHAVFPSTPCRRWPRKRARIPSIPLLYMKKPILQRRSSCKAKQPRSGCTSRGVFASVGSLAQNAEARHSLL